MDVCETWIIDCRMTRKVAIMVRQTRNTTVFAKTTRPEIGNIVRRESLFTRLDGSPGRTVAWISGPPGSGKSTLAASYVETRNYRSAWYQIDRNDHDVATFFHYLRHAARRIIDAELPVFDARHMENVATFSRNFFRQLFTGVASPAALVLDSLTEIPADSPLTTALEAGLAQASRQCCVIVTSRNNPPATLARMRAGGEMVCIGADDLRITPEELAEIASLRGKPLSAETVARLQERTDGWAAGVVLMLEHAKVVGHVAEPPVETTPRVIFEYLAGEIFDRFEPPTQQFLMRVACLPRMTAEVAQALSGEEKAGRLLLNLVHNDYFVREVVGNEGHIFQFHPLLRDFLLSRAAADLPAAVGVAAMRRAAALLREAGQVEDAVSVLVESQDWPEVAASAAELADTMLAEGRRETLAGWLELLPPELQEGNPLLLSALAASRLHVSPRAARHQFERAFRGFRERGDIDGMVRSCSGVIDATILEFDDLATLDHWIDELIGLCKTHAAADADATATLIRALLLRDPGNPALADCLRRAGVARSGVAPRTLPTQTAMAMAMAALLHGDFATAEAMTGDFNADMGDPVRKIGLGFATALHQFLDGDYDMARQSARGGIVTAEAEGIGAYDGWLRILLGACALGAGDFDGARIELKSLEARDLRRGDRAAVHFLRGWLAALEGEAAGAQREIKSAMILAIEAGIPWVEWIARVVMVQVLSAAGDRVGAAAQMRGAATLAERLASPLLRVSTLLAEAAMALEAGDEAAALAPLSAAFVLGREHGFRHVIGLRPRVVAGLCALALRHGVEIDFARTLVRLAHLAPPPSALRLRKWPWPFQIGTLGGFSLLRGNEPIEFSAKGPGRPVELLKVLLALGGSKDARADQLADALWPHVDADYAYNSFTSTLHHLRKIFEDNKAIVLRDGRLSLNPASFWVDTWALEHLIEDMNMRLREPNSQAGETALRTLTEEALSLYRGPFLPEEAEQPSYIARREQIRSRLILVLTKVARRWEETGHAEAAADCYRRCIDADELCEAFYRNLILCYQRHGNTGEAISAYELLRTVLAARLKCMPSPETQAIYAGLRAAAGGTT